MKFISLCSGIEAASVAFGPLGWKAIAFSEIEAFPSAVLAHHYPDVPNMGDMSRFEDWPEQLFIDADAIVGGPPCQAFSIAGARAGLDDPRGNLTLTYSKLINHADVIRIRHGRPPVVCLYENVPGLLSDKTGAFGCLLAGLAGEECELVPPGKRWTDAGAVLGPQRAIAWRILDAQFFALAQRRRRVFVVASARKGFDPATVLFEFDGVRRDTAPSREARQTAPTIPARSTAGGGLATDFDCDGGLIAGKQWPAEVCSTLDTTFGDKQGLEDQHVNAGCPMFVPVAFDTTHTLRGEGFDASEDGTGRGTPLVPAAFHPTQDPISSTDGTTHALGCGSSGGQASVAVAIQDVRGTDKAQNGRGWNDEGTAYTLDTHATQGVAICGAFFAGQGAKAGSIAYSTDVAPTLKASDSGTNRTPSVHINAGAVAFQPRHYSGRERMGGEPSDVCHTLSAQAGQGDSSPHVAYTTKLHNTGSNNALPVVAFTTEQTPKFNDDCALTLTKQSPTGGGQIQSVMSAMQVRRLTPVECERLMGFPDGYTQIPWRKKPASECPDGPRYKALGNSWAVPVAAWIAQRIHRQIAT